MVVSNWQGKQDYQAVGMTTLMEIAELLGIDPYQVTSMRLDNREVVVFGTKGDTLRMPVHYDV